MPALTIENPILNTPFAVPTRHFAFDGNGFPTGIENGRRPSSYLVPIARPKKLGKGAAGLFDDLSEEATVEQNAEINQIRARVSAWRDAGYRHLTPTTKMLLEYWRDERRERRLFFCQIEALETLIFIAEAAPHTGDEWIAELLKTKAEEAGTPLFRMASKMATGSGKTVVMAMVIAWQTLNFAKHPKKDFSNTFLLVAPNITIRDRLQVLQPGHAENYYKFLEIVPPDQMASLGSARVHIVNFHKFKLLETGDAGKFTKTILAGRKKSTAFTETAEEMVNRVTRPLAPRGPIIVLNDEAHHCYRSKPLADGKKLSAEEKKEAKIRDEEARLWINGLEAIHAKFGVRTVFDLSATPFYLGGSGYGEGRLFPWVVSDFSLMDAIESGIVKTPRVPTSDNTLGYDLPVFRDLWSHIRGGLGKKDIAAVVPKQLEAALRAMYGHYKTAFERWETEPNGKPAGNPPPVYIVVCNNTNVSKMVFDAIAGYEEARTHPDGTPIVHRGELPLFDNATDQYRWAAHQKTILVDSSQLESEDALSPDFKKMMAHQIEEFRRSTPQDIDDAALMREVLNTVGKKGKLGEGIRCVVSVSMLTEGWDANTVTHIVGVRAFASSLIREQVIGRGLRRVSYAVNAEGKFDPEYAEVYGVPFRYLPVAGQPPEAKDKPAPPLPGAVKAIPERLVECPWLEIVFPRVEAYQYEPPPPKLVAKFSKQSHLSLSTEDIPTSAMNSPIVGEEVEMTLAELKTKRMAEVEFKIAECVLSKYNLRDGPSPGLFPQLLAIVRDWIAGYVEQQDDTFLQMLWLGELRHSAAEKIFNAIPRAGDGPPKVRAILQAEDATGTTANLSYATLKACWTADATKCHMNYMPFDSDWEAHLAQKMEDAAALPELRAYVKNQNLGFRIPYIHEGKPGNYYPDFLVRIDDGHGPHNILTLIVETSGRPLEQKQAKVDTAKTIFVPAVNALGTFGRWDFLELSKPGTFKTDLKAFLHARKSDTLAG